jgi:hypothetical protein
MAAIAGVARNLTVREPRNRVVQVRRFGGPEELEVADAPLPTAGRGEVRVRVLAASVEYTDVTIRRHLYPRVRRRPLFVMGYDVVGEIDQLGDGESGFQPGADMTVLGSDAAYRTLRASHLIRVPAGVDVAEAAAMILSWTTAYQLLHRAARVQAGQRVLVHGAAGAVGQALVVLGRMAGVELWGTARGKHAALIRELGATPIDYQREDFTRVLTGGFDVVFSRGIQSRIYGGRVSLALPAMRCPSPPVPCVPCARSSQSVSAVNLASGTSASRLLICNLCKVPAGDLPGEGWRKPLLFTRARGALASAPSAGHIAGHQCRRRMGRLGAVRDGVGKDQQAPRLHLGLAAIRRGGGLG